MAILMPRAGDRYLKPLEVVRRVEETFAYVETSKEGTRKHVYEWMNQLAFVAADGRAATDDVFLAQLDRLQEDALFVYFGDDLGSDGVLLSMLMIPGQPLMIDDSSEVAQDRAHALIVRCAAALKYDIIEQRCVGPDAGTDPNHSPPGASR